MFWARVITWHLKGVVCQEHCKGCSLIWSGNFFLLGEQAEGVSRLLIGAGGVLIMPGWIVESVNCFDLSLPLCDWLPALFSSGPAFPTRAAAQRALLRPQLPMVVSCSFTECGYPAITCSRGQCTYLSGNCTEGVGLCSPSPHKALPAHLQHEVEEMPFHPFFLFRVCIHFLLELLFL